MDFFQTVGGQALASVLKSSLPKIADGLQRIAVVMEKQNEAQERVSTVDPDLRHLLDAASLGLPPKWANLDEIERQAKDRRENPGAPDAVTEEVRNG